MAKEAIIALDQGSSSSRALVFDAKGRVLCRAQFPIRTFYPKPGWVEHDPEEIFRTQEKALDSVLSRIPASTRILGAGIASQRSTFVLWDSRNGKALCRAPSWQDGRAASLVPGWAASLDEISEKTGLYLTPYYSGPKAAWLIDQIPKVRAARDQGNLRLAPIGSYLLWRLTRGESWIVDPSLAQRTLLFNIRTMEWDPELLEKFGLPRSALPSVSDSAGQLGVMVRRGRKIPILAMLGDQQSAALGLGGEGSGTGILNYGTGAFFLLNTGKSQHRVPGLLTSVAWRRSGGSCDFLEEGTVHSAGTSFQWLKDNFALIDKLEKVDAMCRKSKQRVLALSAIGGLGAPRWDYSTFTAFSGLNSSTRPEDLVRGVAEGIAFLIADVVSAIRSSGIGIGSVHASGGLSRIPYLLQFQADILQTPILRVSEAESTAVGVASLAAGQAGIPWDRAKKKETGKWFRPSMNPDAAQRLVSGWRLFVEYQQRASAELRKLGVLPS